MTKIDDMMAEYAAHIDAFERTRVRVEMGLRDALLQAGIDVHVITSRTKTADSLRRKLARPDKTYAALWDVTDLVGVRVVTFFEDSLAQVARLIEQRFAVDFAHSSDKLSTAAPAEFGYRSLHYVCSAQETDVPAAFRFEIQVRTVLQHAWAEVEHDLGYKANAHVPATVRRRFSRVASLLEIADQEFVALRRDLAQHQQAALQVAATEAHGVLPLDRVTLEAVTSTDRVATLDRALAAQLGQPLDRALWSPDYLVALCLHAGLNTTRDVALACAQHGDRALAFVDPYFAFAAQTWGLDKTSLGSIGRGYALFFVAHAHVLADEELGLNRVARLTQLYTRLDYPHDGREAQRVASALAAVLPGGAQPI